MWATILALIWLHDVKLDAKDEWNLLAKKAISWLHANDCESSVTHMLKCFGFFQFLLRTDFVIFYCSIIFDKVCEYWKFSAWLQSAERSPGIMNFASD